MVLARPLAIALLSDGKRRRPCQSQETGMAVGIQDVRPWEGPDTSHAWDRKDK